MKIRKRDVDELFSFIALLEKNAQFDLINRRYSYLRKKRFLFLIFYYF